MAITKAAQEYRERMFPNSESTFNETDPEFMERFNNFTYDEVVNQDDLDDRTRFMAILASLIGCQGIDEFKAIVPAALNFDVTPVEIKEIVYQSFPHLGVGRAFPFLRTVNEIFQAREIKLPLKSQATTTMETRFEAGRKAQEDIFGSTIIKDVDQLVPEETQHIIKWITDNCFGDYYTRKGLDYKQREMITFCFLMAQGGCEAPLTTHASANMRLGNDRAFLLKIISQCIPYIGYPRALSALQCVDEAAESFVPEKGKI